jgi:hypothetical protein
VLGHRPAQDCSPTAWRPALRSGQNGLLGVDAVDGCSPVEEVGGGSWIEQAEATVHVSSKEEGVDTH